MQQPTRVYHPVVQLAVPDELDDKTAAQFYVRSACLLPALAIWSVTLLA